MLPREHGVWAMIVGPWLLAAVVSALDAGPAPLGLQLALLGASLAGYLALSATLTYLRTANARREPRPLMWAAVYALIGGAAAAPVVLTRPLLIVAVLGAGLALPVELYYLRQRDERALLNGVVSVLALTLSGPAALYLAAPRLDSRLALLAASGAMFFLLSLLFVRSLIRARRQTAFTWISIGLHVATPAAFAALGRPWLALAFAPALLRAATLSRRKLAPHVIGIIEIVTTLAFVGLAAFALHRLP